MCVYALSVMFVGCIKDLCYGHHTINTYVLEHINCKSTSVQCSDVAVSVQENSTLKLQWRPSQMTPCSETNLNTWANVSLLVYNTTGVSKITALVFKVMF